MLIGFQMKSYFKLMEEMFIKDRIMRDVMIEYYEDAKSFVGAYGTLKIFFMKKIRNIQRFDIKDDTVVKSIHLEGLRVIGNPSEMAYEYYKQSAGEM